MITVDGVVEQTPNLLNYLPFVNFITDREPFTIVILIEKKKN